MREFFNETDILDTTAQPEFLARGNLQTPQILHPEQELMEDKILLSLSRHQRREPVKFSVTDREFKRMHVEFLSKRQSDKIRGNNVLK